MSDARPTAHDTSPAQADHGAHTRRPGETGARMTWVNYGIVFGPALGLVLALLVAGDAALPWGLALGAALGVTVGALVELAQDRRRRHRA